MIFNASVLQEMSSYLSQVGIRVNHKRYQVQPPGTIFTEVLFSFLWKQYRNANIANLVYYGKIPLNEYWQSPKGGQLPGILDAWQ